MFPDKESICRLHDVFATEEDADEAGCLEGSNWAFFGEFASELGEALRSVIVSVVVAEKH